MQEINICLIRNYEIINDLMNTGIFGEDDDEYLIAFIKKLFPWKQKPQLLRNKFFGDLSYLSLRFFTRHHWNPLPQIMLEKLKSCKWVLGTSNHHPRETKKKTRELLQEQLIFSALERRTITSLGRSYKSVKAFRKKNASVKDKMN